MMDYTVFKAKILTKSSIEIANASLFEILFSILDIWQRRSMMQERMKCAESRKKLLEMKSTFENLQFMPAV